MESVETVLETYGGPEEDWKDTYGVSRTLEEFKLNQVCNFRGSGRCLTIEAPRYLDLRAHTGRSERK
jgi:hypothetical protein